MSLRFEFDMWRAHKGCVDNSYSQKEMALSKKAKEESNYFYIKCMKECAIIVFDDFHPHTTIA